MSCKVPDNLADPRALRAIIWELEERLVASHPSPASDALHQLQAAQDDPRLHDSAKLLAVLRRVVEDGPRVDITLPARPSAQLKLTLIQWLRGNVHPEVIIGWSVDRTLGGGMVLRTPNHTYDWSFSRRLWVNRSQLPKLVRDVR